MNRKEKIEKAAMKYLQRTTPNPIQTRPTILGTFKTGVKWADEHPASPWHSVADGNIPKVDTDCLFAYEGVIDKGYMREDRSLSLDSEFAPLLDIDDVDYWMEIPKLPK